jgi:type III secretion protein Q
LEGEAGVPLPFSLPVVAAGLAALTPAARRLGAEVAAAAAARLAPALDAPVELRGWPAVGPPWSRTPAAALTVELAALPGLATLEVEPALVMRLVDRLAGGDGLAAAASELTPLERATLELLALLALDGACAVGPVGSLLAPRLARAPAGAPGTGALGLELELGSGAIRGRARLILPAAALRALGGTPSPAESPLRLPVSVRRGTASLLPEELDSLEPGDALLLDPERSDCAPDALVLPGGFRARGRLEAEGFRVEEAEMPTRTTQIPVTLEVELCRVELPLAELARLEPGAVLPLHIDRRGRVTLRAGERAVARGELVEIDGAVGVRVEALEVDP